MNAGLHDMGIHFRVIKGPEVWAVELTANHSTEQHVKNVRRYLTLLRKGCRRIVWLSTSAIRHPEASKWLQRNWKVATWNAHVAALIGAEFPSVFFVDVYPKTATAEHDDNVHLTEGYYQTLAKLFLGCVAPVHCPRLTGSYPNWHFPTEAGSTCARANFSGIS